MLRLERFGVVEFLQQAGRVTGLGSISALDAMRVSGFLFEIVFFEPTKNGSHATIARAAARRSTICSTDRVPARTVRQPYFVDGVGDPAGERTEAATE